MAIGPDGSLWVLEFARVMPNVSCLTREGYQVKSGRLSRLAPGCLTADGVRADCALETILDDLNYPGALLPMEDGSLYISEVFPGRILRITFGEQNVSPTATEDLTAADMIASTRRDYPTTEYDARLSSVIPDHGLLPRPGHDVRGGDTAVARLGQALFFDPILSGDRNISCATCHHPRLAMADGRALPIGAGGSGLGPGRTFVQQVQLGGEAGDERRQAGRTDVASGVTVVHNPFVGQFVARNSPTILNSALLPLQFWDGRVESYASKVKTKEHFVNTMELTDPLAAQALFPMTSLHEMAGATLGGLAPQDIRRTLIERLRATPTYVQLFQDAFGTGDGTADRRDHPRTDGGRTGRVRTQVHLYGFVLGRVPGR